MIKHKLSLSLLLVALTLSSLVKADSWRAFESGYAYVNGSFTMGNRLPQDRSIVKAFRVADGNTLLLMSAGYPIAMDKGAAFSSESDVDFRSLQYMASPLASVVDNNGKFYFHNTAVVAYYDTNAKKWLGINVRNDSKTGDIPSVKLDNVFGLTFDRDNNLFLTGTKDDKPVFAVLKGDEWEIVPVNENLVPADAPGNRKVSGDDRYDIITKGNGLRSSYIMSSPVLSSDGSIWMLLGEPDLALRLARYENGQMQVLDAKPASGLVKDNEGNILFANSDGINIIRQGKFNFEVLIKGSAYSLFADKNALWYSFSPISDNQFPTPGYTYLKRYDFNTKKTKTYTSQNTPFSSTIGWMAGDSNGNIAFLQNSSLFLLDRSDLGKYAEKWQQFSPGYMDDEDFLKIDNVGFNKNGKYPTTVSYDVLNNRWIGIYQNNKWDYYKMAVDVEAGKGMGLKGTYLNCACYTSKGILVGTGNDGLMLFDPATEKATYIDGYDQKKHGKDVRDIKEDRNGNIWIGTNKSLIIYDGTTFDLFDKKICSTPSTAR